MQQYRISIPLIIGEDPTNNQVVLGFVHKDTFIFDPFLSSCGRLKVDPFQAYQIDAWDADSLQALNRFIQYRATRTMEDIRTHVHMCLDHPDDSTPYPIDEPGRQAIARAIATEMLRLLGQSPNKSST